jgi:hypothetical protein
MNVRRLLLLLIACSLPCTGVAQQSERFERWEIHYSVFNSTFLEPAVASRYGVVRGKDQAVINIAVREHLPEGGTAARRARIEGRTWDLFQNHFLEFREIAENDAIYYIGVFEFSDAQVRFFNLQLLPEGADRSRQIKFQRKLYVE